MPMLQAAVWTAVVAVMGPLVNLALVFRAAAATPTLLKLAATVVEAHVAYLEVPLFILNSVVVVVTI